MFALLCGVSSVTFPDPILQLGGIDRLQRPHFSWDIYMVVHPQVRSMVMFVTLESQLGIDMKLICIDILSIDSV